MSNLLNNHKPKDSQGRIECLVLGCGQLHYNPSGLCHKHATMLSDKFKVKQQRQKDKK